MSSSRVSTSNDDHVALADAAIGPPCGRLGRDVAGHEAVGRAREPAVGEQRHVLAQALAHDRRGHVQHLAHAGPALRALVADHDHVAGLDRAAFDRRERVLLAVEHARRARGAECACGPRPSHAALRREVALQDHEPAASASAAVSTGRTTSWPGVSSPRRPLRRWCGRSTVSSSPCSSPPRAARWPTSAHAAGVDPCRSRRIVPPGFRSAMTGVRARCGRSRRCVERHAELAGDRDAGAARRWWSRRSRDAGDARSRTPRAS